MDKVEDDVVLSSDEKRYWQAPGSSLPENCRCVLWDYLLEEKLDHLL